MRYEPRCLGLEPKVYEIHPTFTSTKNGGYEALIHLSYYVVAIGKVWTVGRRKKKHHQTGRIFHRLFTAQVGVTSHKAAFLAAEVLSVDGRKFGHTPVL